MNYRIAFIGMLTFNLSIAQLSVRNSAYIFVDDQYVFVENDVNLNEAASTIYLRNEGQLIQGSGTETAATKNSGIGELSVYQDGNVGVHEYNYWCSPIGDNSSNNTINNLFGITLLNDITGLTTATPATTVTDPQFNGTASPLNIEPYWIWKFIANNGYFDWVQVLSATTINPGEGFTMKGVTGTSANNPGDNQNYDFRGKPNTGTMSVAVDNAQFTLVGNPYPSAMDALAYIHDTQNAAVITGVLHYWEQDPNVNSHRIAAYDGGYATYTINALGTVETYTPATFSTYDLGGNINGSGSGSPSGKQPRRYIPIGQGLMVEGTATGVVRAKNVHRVFYRESSANSEFFKDSNPKGKVETKTNGFFKVPSDYKRFRLNIDFNNIYTRQLLENFHSTATFGFDYGLESTINAADILASDAYFSGDDKTYLAEALPFDESLKIPLTIKLAEDMPVRIRIADIQNFDSNQPIYIHDKETDLYVNLKVQDFDMNLETGHYSNRFEVTFNGAALDIEETTFNDFNIIQNNNISRLKILNPNALDLKSFNLFDVSGKQVLNETIAGNKKTYNYSTKSLSDGIYIARISLSNNQGYTKKVIISNKN